MGMGVACRMDNTPSPEELDSLVSEGMALLPPDPITMAIRLNTDRYYKGLNEALAFLRRLRGRDADGEEWKRD